MKDFDWEAQEENRKHEIYLIEQLGEYSHSDLVRAHFTKILTKCPYWNLIESDLELFKNGALTKVSFQQCILDASRIWKEKMADDKLSEQTLSKEPKMIDCQGYLFAVNAIREVTHGYLGNLNQVVVRVGCDSIYLKYESEEAAQKSYNKFCDLLNPEKID